MPKSSRINQSKNDKLLTMEVSYSELEYAAKKKVTRQDRFLMVINAVIPWSSVVAEIEPYYPKVIGLGQLPIGVERILRMYIAQQCFGLSDERIEDEIYNNQAIRTFVGIDLSHESAPDAATLLKFRRLLVTHELTECIFNAINTLLAVKGLLLKEGTVVDATIFAAPSSIKNKDGKIDNQMHQVKNGYMWHFGMKPHIGVDAQSSITHSLVTTPANLNDVKQAHSFLQGEENVALGDVSYQGVDKRFENQNCHVHWEVAMRLGKLKALPETLIGILEEKIEQLKPV